MSPQKEAFGREKIRHYLESQPYRGLFISDDEEFLFFFEETQNVTGQKKGTSELILKMAKRNREAGTELASVHPQAFDMKNAKSISTQNFISRSAQIIDYFAETDDLLILMDEANEEKFNLYIIDVSTGLQKQLTHAPQVLMPKVSKDRTGVWYLTREMKSDGSFIGGFCKVDIQSKVVSRIFNDEGDDYKLNFVSPLEVSPERILIFLDKGGRRNEFQLFDVNLKTGERKMCLDESFAKHRNSIEVDELCGDELIFTSMKNGFENLYAFDTLSRNVRALTEAKQKNQVGVKGLRSGCEAFIYQIFDTFPDRDSEVVLSDLEGREFQREKFAGTVTTTNHPCTLWLAQNSMTSTPRLVRVHGGRKKHDGFSEIGERPQIDYVRLHDEREREDFVHGTRTVASYRSYDGLEIPALVFLPKGEVRGAIVIAFYGGEDYYHSRYQMYLEQGIAVFSPAVRGSWGWGQNWENLLKGDLGGGEILDVIWGARFIAKTLNLPEQRVGVEGGSHGGYAVLRTLTLPKVFRGVDTSFNFGFGVCWAGFADLIEFHSSSWISDWIEDVLAPLGKNDRAKNEKLYRDRSPVNFVDQLRAPLFISHGKNDRRVPLSTMTEFLNLIENTPYKHKVIIQDGEGHKGGGLEKQVQTIAAEFDFVNENLSKDLRVDAEETHSPSL